jgi:hypothetical protein
MPNHKPPFEEIVLNLDPCEKRVLRLLGSENISQSKNLRKETIKKKLPNRYGKSVDKAIDSLLSKGLMFPYRHKNYGLSSLGVKVAQSLVKEFNKDRYSDLSRIFMII